MGFPLFYPAFSRREEREELLELAPGEVTDVLFPLAASAHDRPSQPVFENLERERTNGETTKIESRKTYELHRPNSIYSMGKLRSTTETSMR